MVFPSMCYYSFVIVVLQADFVNESPWIIHLDPIIFPTDVTFFFNFALVAVCVAENEASKFFSSEVVSDFLHVKLTIEFLIFELVFVDALRCPCEGSANR